MARDLKVGDRVRVKYTDKVEQSYCGQEGVVIQAGEFPTVEFDDPDLNPGGTWTPDTLFLLMPDPMPDPRNTEEVEQWLER